ncbi:MAG: efflux RND transporter periplasmic adaptor subunit [Candidatus Hydrogenedentes bacterium]|nr:efflux RND transporter periplasmic adaptor subunit [Candidatus Hydrogenedentota bacterium]
MIHRKNKLVAYGAILSVAAIVTIAITFWTIPAAITAATETSRDPNRLWCGEHGVYEDECEICHPELASKKKTRESEELQCPEHHLPEHECGICHPEETKGLTPGQGLKIRFATAESAGRAGVETVLLEHGHAFNSLEVLSRVSYNQNRLAHVTTLVPGIIQNVLVEAGAAVSQGQVLLEIASTEVAEAKSEYLTALATQSLKSLVFQRERDLVAKDISTLQEFQQAQAENETAQIAARNAQQKLLNLGFSEAQVKETAKSRSSGSLLPLRAPFAGTVVDRSAVIGERVEPGQTLVSIADLSTMWLEISIPENQLTQAGVGNTVQAEFDGLSNQRFEGYVSWLDTRVDEPTRTVKARAEVTNLDGRLRHGMFGRVHIERGAMEGAAQLPFDAVQRFDGQPFVFVQLADDLYEVRRVELGGKHDDHVEVLAGLSPQDRIVTARSFVVKSEFLKSRLGAGCVDE